MTYWSVFWISLPLPRQSVKNRHLSLSAHLYQFSLVWDSLSSEKSYASKSLNLKMHAKIQIWKISSKSLFSSIASKKCFVKAKIASFHLNSALLGKRLSYLAGHYESVSGFLRREVKKSGKASCQIAHLDLVKLVTSFIIDASCDSRSFSICFDLMFLFSPSSQYLLLPWHHRNRERLPA